MSALTAIYKMLIYLYPRPFREELGICQSIGWRPKFDRMVVWIVVNVLGWSLGMFLPHLMAFLLQGVDNLWLSTLFPVVFAAVATGSALLWFSEGSHDLAK